MADLRYEDVQRAAQAALQNMQNQMNYLQNLIVSINNQVSRIDDQEYKIDDLGRQLGLINQSIGQVNNSIQALSSQLGGMQNVPSMVNDLRYRLEALERFANDMSNYLHQRQSREEADDDDL